MKAKALTKKMNMNNVFLKTINYLAAIGLLIGAATVSAGDNELWRNQVSSIPGQTIGSFTVGKPGGSSFLDAVRENHLPTTQDDTSMVESQRRLLSDTDTASGDWFFNTITPDTYGYGS